MCIIQGETESVSNTKILVSATRNPQHQLIVYSNSVQIATNPVAMILPFPNYSKNNAVKVIPTTQDDNAIFTKLEKIFPDEYALEVMSSNCFGSPSPRSVKLAVHRAGSYRYSIVNNLADFDKLDNNVFKLYDQNIVKIFKKYYKEYGFIVCIIDQSATYTPFMYITEKMPNNRYFIPTRHYHGHSSHSIELWDHKIYILGTNDPFKFAKMYGIELCSATEDIVPADYSLQTYIPKINQTDCKAIKMHGTLPNGDVIIQAM